MVARVSGASKQSEQEHHHAQRKQNLSDFGPSVCHEKRCQTLYDSREAGVSPAYSVTSSTGMPCNYGEIWNNTTYKKKDNTLTSIAAC